MKNVNDNSPPEQILTLPANQDPTHWSSDDVLVFQSGAPQDLWVVDPSSDSAVATEYLSSESAIQFMRVSASGDLAAYMAFESSVPEVYVRSFPEAGARERISQGGGQIPFWSPDGNTIYYWAGAAGSTMTLMAARIQRGPPFVVTATDSILSGPYNPFNWSLHPDGDRFVTTRPATSASPEGQAGGAVRHLIVVNWFEELLEGLGN